MEEKEITQERKEVTLQQLIAEFSVNQEFFDAEIEAIKDSVELELYSKENTDKAIELLQSLKDNTELAIILFRSIDSIIPFEIVKHYVSINLEYWEMLKMFNDVNKN